MLNGSNIWGNAMALFDGEIQRNFAASYQESGQWPTGFAARKITEDAVAKTSAYIDTHASLRALTDMAGKGSAPAAAPVPTYPTATAPAAPMALPKGVTMIK